MSTEELYAEAIGRMAKIGIHPIHKAMMEECCEVTISSNPNVTDPKLLVQAVQVAFLSANSTLKATLVGRLQAEQADRITVNYRGQEFVLDADDPFLDKVALGTI